MYSEAGQSLLCRRKSHMADTRIHRMPGCQECSVWLCATTTASAPAAEVTWEGSDKQAKAVPGQGNALQGGGRAGYLRGRVTEEALRSPEVWAPPSKSLQDVAGRCRGRHRSSLSPRVRMRLHFGSSFFPWNRSYWNIPCVSSIHFLSFHTLVDFFKAPAGSYQSVKWNAPFNLADGKLCILTSMPQTALWRANSGSAHEPVPSSQLNKGRECQGEVFAEKS